MGYKKIYHAAINQDVDELHRAIKFACIDESAPGTYFFSAVSKLAMEHNIIAVEFLLQHGANISYAAYGAAKGGHRDFAEALLLRGANIDWVARGAAESGDRDFTEVLILHGANINKVVVGAAQGGHRDWTERLILRGADITEAALGAGMGGDKDFADVLITRGADVIVDDVSISITTWVAQGSAISGYRDRAEALISRQGANIKQVAEGAALGGDRDFAEALLLRGASISCVAQCAAICGRRDLAEVLMARGADISIVAQGAAIGGHKDFAEVLMSRGADFNHVARGAAEGGHRDWAESLILHGADITTVACGAVAGGYKDWADALILRGAEISVVACHAAFYGHRDFVEALILRHASVDEVARGAAEGGHISQKQENQLAYLSLFPFDLIPTLVIAFKELVQPIVINEIIEKRAIAISKHIRIGKLSYSQALARTDPACNGMLFLLMLLAMKGGVLPADSSIPELPPEVWQLIFNFVVPMQLDVKEFEQLGFVMGRAYLCAQLSSYQSSFGKHKERACSFLQVVSATHNKEEMQTLISKQVEVLQESNSSGLLEPDQKYKMNTDHAAIDKYHGIIGFWEKMRTKQAVVFKDEAPQRCLI